MPRVVEMVDRAAAVGPKPPNFDHAYIQFVQGLAEYRQDRPAQAIPLLEAAAARLTNRSGPRLALAMAQFRAGSAAEARRSLVTAIRAYDWTEMQADQPTIWISHVLRREAEQLILPNLPAFLDGEYQPGTVRALALLEICRLTDHSLIPAYPPGLAADPRLAAALRRPSLRRRGQQRASCRRADAQPASGAQRGSGGQAGSGYERT